MSKKNIGQYFSGSLVADMLVASIGPHEINYAIDPMAGCGDMLCALIRKGVDAAALYGIDVDPEACEMAPVELAVNGIVNRDAFSDESVEIYQRHQWDVVITNPPYVRYQSLVSYYGDNAVSIVRESLCNVLRRLGSPDEMAPYLKAAKKYSGLSDLAIPSWILCAALVRPGGKLAMVLPQSWLTREYSFVVRELLTTLFHVECIIEDDGRCWFSDAQVKTCLLVARKLDEFADVSCFEYRHIGISKNIASSESLVGNLSYCGSVGYEAFSEILYDREPYRVNGLWAERLPQTSLIRNEHRAFVADKKLAGLSDWGLSVGQGLRTGANEFFYFKAQHDDTVVNDIWTECAGLRPVSEDALPLIPALRRQRDLGEALVIDPKLIRNRVLVIEEPLLFEPCENSLLCDYIKYCEARTIALRGKTQFIPELSAVKPNGALSTDPKAKRFWYMLPPMGRRHRPDLVIPRVNGGRANCYLMPPGRSTIADANFCSLWFEEYDTSLILAVFALMNSTVVQLELESSCNILGGGALKCEASTIRRLALPYPSSGLVNKLALQGERLAACSHKRGICSCIHSIDIALMEHLSSSARSEELVREMADELQCAIQRRSR